MSMHFRKAKKFYTPEYKDGRVKQAFKDQCDVNKIIKKHQLTNAASHAMLYPPEAYAEFDGVDLLEAYERGNRAQEIFDQLPSEIRNEFSNDAFAFVSFMNRPDNEGRHAQVLKALAEPGSYFPNPVARGGGGAGAATPPPTPPVEAAGTPPVTPPPGEPPVEGGVS